MRLFNITPMRPVMEYLNTFPTIHKDCLQNGFKSGIYEINSLVVEYVRRYDFRLSGLQNLPSGFNELCSAFLPYPVLRLGKFPRKLVIPSRRDVPSVEELLTLVKAYERHDVESYLKLEAALSKKTGIKNAQNLMKAVMIWLLIYSVIKNLNDGRCFTALSYEFSGGNWRSITQRYLKDNPLNSHHRLNHSELQTISENVWRTAARPVMPFIMNPGFVPYLTSLLPFVGKESFAGAAALAFLELDKTQRDANFKIDIDLAGRLKSFCDGYAKGKGVLGRINRTGSHPGKTSKRYLSECAYGKVMPASIPHKSALYFFVDGAVLEALHIQETFKLSENVCAIFCLFCFQHLPLFNLHTDFRYTKQTKLWPKFSRAGKEASFTVASLSFVHFIKQALRHHGPINYEAWAKAGFPKDLSSFNSLDSFKNEVLGQEATLASCSKAFIVDHKDNDVLAA